MAATVEGREGEPIAVAFWPPAVASFARCPGLVMRAAAIAWSDAAPTAWSSSTACRAFGPASRRLRAGLDVRTQRGLARSRPALAAGFAAGERRGLRSLVLDRRDSRPPPSPLAPGRRSICFEERVEPGGQLRYRVQPVKAEFGATSRAPVSSSPIVLLADAVAVGCASATGCAGRRMLR